MCLVLDTLLTCLSPLALAFCLHHHPSLLTLGGFFFLRFTFKSTVGCSQPHYHLVGLSHSRSLSLCLNYPRLGTRKLGTATMCQSSLQLFELANSAVPVSSHGNHTKTSCLCFPSAPSASWPNLLFLCVVLHGKVVYWDLEFNNYIFNGSCHLICWTCHT